MLCTHLILLRKIYIYVHIYFDNGYMYTCVVTNLSISQVKMKLNKT